MRIDDDIGARMLAWRHDFHAHPETAFEEHRTSAIVAQALRLMGLDVTVGLARTGVVATLSNGEGRTIGLRADMDALHLQELGARRYASRCAGKMHACGHDGHTAMLLGAAEYLARHRSFQGTVRFIFQPAEETEGGGREMVREGLFDRFPCDAVYGMHNFPTLARGRFALRSGTMSAALDTFEIGVTGKGCHAALPELGVDAIVASAQLVGALQALISRRIGASEAGVLSVTQIHGGDTWNVLPETVVLRGTVRSLGASVQQAIESGMRAVCEGVARTSGTQIGLDYRHGYPSVVNTEREAGLAASAAARLVGANNVDTAMVPTMGSEDFAFMLQRCRGAWITIGAGETGNDPPVHSPYYDFNDAILPLGAAYWVALVHAELGGRPNP
ncbi:amidohydrolase [Hydrogenophaga sp. YM1]|uniref:M20 aminoacylase family protein n=1 Tax=Hydrogenophaga sp. YM1 TaxID=2806262 RepID=UPI001956A85E|nr:M20 aminoacylase family protein [Hydrogenophaga sp. YM1]QRR34621.1 amidohydrolase [Hydrogenophaga sp. YM1]